jgi:hypothetical protein
MKQFSWIHMVLAAAMVVAGGAVTAFADGDSELRKKVKVDVDGDVESFELDDLADGESREFEAGEHTITVTRSGDELSVLVDGEDLVGRGLGGNHMVWLTEDEFLESAGEGGAERVLIVNRQGGWEHDLRTIMVHAECDSEAEDCEQLDIDIESLGDLDVHALEGLPLVTVMTSSAGPHPLVLTARAVTAGMVRYRCEETGSELLVEEQGAVSDSYVCPATGCLMERVDEPRIKVIKLRHDVEISDDTDG